jgi:peptidoglycan/LPS O-acetylase OafA/YrhL
MRQIRFRRNLTALLLGFISCTSAAWAQASASPQTQIQDTGISGLWVLANISFAGMRAQNNRRVLWRTLAFIFGLPGTIVTFFVVAEGSDRAYGIDLPRKGRP